MSPRYRWEVVAMLWAAYFLHQADRQMFSVVLVIANVLAAPSSAWLGWVADDADVGRSVSALSILFVVAAGLLWSTRGEPVVADSAAEEAAWSRSTTS